MKSLLNRYYLWIIVILAAVFYFPTLFFEFVNFDDNIYIYRNADVLNFNLKSITKFFTEYIYGHYHPLTMISYGVQAKIHGLNPHYFHAFNLALHVINIYLLFGVLKHLNLSDATSKVALLIFALHPLQVESVVWIGTRGGLINTFFALLTLKYYFVYLAKNKIQYVIIASIFLLLSLFAKSTTLMLPLVLFAIDLYKKRKFNYTLIIEKLPLLFISLIMGMVAIKAARDIGSVETTSFLGYTMFNRYWLILYSLSFYFTSIIWPYKLANLQYNPIELNGLFELQYYLYPILFIAFVITAFYSIKNKKVLWFSLAFSFLFLIPVINIVPLGGTIVSERYFYLAGIGFSLLIAECITMYVSQKHHIYVLAFTAILLGALTIKRSAAWSNSESLYKDLTTKYPQYSYGYYGYGNAFLDKSEFEKAIDNYSKAIRIAKNSYEYYMNRGIAKLKLNFIESAIADLDTAIFIDPSKEAPFANRGFAFQEVGKLTESLKDLNIAIGINPNEANTYFVRGITYTRLGDKNSACTDFKTAAKMGLDGAKDQYERLCKVQDLVRKNKNKEIKGEQIYYANGTIKFETIDSSNYKVLLYYDSLSNLLEKGKIENGKYNGWVCWYYPDGSLQRTGYYRDVVPYGKWQEYYENAVLKASYQYSRGSLHGNYRYFYENGSLWTSRQYKFGALYNVDSILNQQGNLLEIGTFKDGNGILNQYNTLGKLTQTNQYSNGFLIR